MSSVAPGRAAPAENGRTPAATDPPRALPLVTVTRGQVTPEEIAAIAVLLAAASGNAQVISGRAAERGWASRRRTLNPGADRNAGWGSV